MPFVQQTETQRLSPPLTLPCINEGDWVEILTVYNAGIRRRVLARAIGVDVMSQGGPSASVDIFQYRQALLEEIIRSWSDSAPVTPDAIEQLHPGVQDWIAQQYDDLTKVRTDAEKKDSEASSSISVPASVNGSLTSSPTSQKSTG